MKIELEKWQVQALRNYFGLNDKTNLEHWAYDVFDKALKEQCTISDVVGRSEQFSDMTLEQAIAKAKPNLDKIKDVDKHLDDIR